MRSASSSSIDNRPGASGIIGTDIVAKAQADGYTLLVMSLTHAVNPSVFKLPYDTEKDLAPVTLIAGAPLILVVNPQVPVHSVAEFIAYAKANPGKLNFGSGGVAATPHLAGVKCSPCTRASRRRMCLTKAAHRHSPIWSADN